MDSNLEPFSVMAVEAALQRRLTRDEKSCLKRLDDLYRAYQRTGRVNVWDLCWFGHPYYYGTYEAPASLIPVPAKSKEEFWAWLAYGIVKARGKLPEFLQPLTDFSSIAEPLAKIERNDRVEHWRHLLRSAAETSPEHGGSEMDFRLLLSPEGPSIEWKPAPSGNFQVLKKTKAREFANRFLNGDLPVVPEAVALWNILARQLERDSSFKVAYDDERFAKGLNVLLRLPGSQERILTGTGQPFVRPPERLHWSIKASSDGEDYHFEMVLPDGTRPQALFLALDGQPPLYVTADAIYAGPPVTDLEVGKPHLIPAPALETEHGVQFLLSMGAELPPKIAKRVERVALGVVFHCSLGPSYPGSSTEELGVRVVAQTADGGATQHYQDAEWTIPGAIRSKKGRITVTERQSLSPVPELIQALGAKWYWPSKKWQTRVTRDFPDKFLAWLAMIPPHIEVRLDPMLQTLAAGPVAGTMKLDCTETEIDWFDLRVTVDVTDTELAPEEIKLLLDARGKFVRLKGKGWRRLEFDISEEEDQRLARLGLSVSEFSSEPQRLHALQLADEAAHRFLPKEQVEEIRRRVDEIKTRVTPAIPGEIQAQLRPYQVEGFHFLAYLTANRFGGILADDMGLGKTLQTLTWLAWVRLEAKGNMAPILVVCPKSVMETWRNEAARFVPELRVKLWRGSDPQALRAKLKDTDLLVLNYAQLRALGEGLAGVRWKAAILDEGQYIKNPDSQTAQVARSLKAEYRLALSGTPIENRLMDLWSLMAFAMPGVLGSRAQFGRQFNLAADPLARRRLAARVRPFLLRRTKGQVATDLPDRAEEDLICEMEGEQRTLYRAEFKHAQQMLLKVNSSQDLNEFRFHFLTSLLRLRQICCHPALVNEKFEGAESAKLNACLDLLEPLMEEGHKVLVFSQFVSMLEILRRAIKERDWQHYYLAGDTENRGELVDTFQKADGAAIFLISLKAGGFGLNLTAASYVVLFDPWWNPAVENQAIDRTHRIGQTRKVMAYRVLIKESIEEKIRALQRKKSALAEDILGEENFAQSLTLNDLQFLFSGE